MWTANDLLGKAKDGSLRMKRDHYIVMQEAYKLVIECDSLNRIFFRLKFTVWPIQVIALAMKQFNTVTIKTCHTNQY